MHGLLSCTIRVCRWLLPTLEVVGIQGGHTGKGTRGVVVAKASAKIMCRLVPHQNASEVLQALRQHVMSHAPPHTEFSLSAVTSHGRVFTEPYFIPKDALGNRAAAKVRSSLRDILCRLWRHSSSSVHCMCSLPVTL